MKIPKPWKNLSVKAQGYLFIGALAALIVAVGALHETSQNKLAEECPGHWHSVMGIYHEDYRVRMLDPNFLNHDKGYHLHADDMVLHTHPATLKCVPMEDWFTHLDILIDHESITYGERHDPALQQTWYASENTTLKIYFQEYGEPWEIYEGKQIKQFLNTQHPDGGRMAVLYGEYTQEQVDHILNNRLREVPPAYIPPEHRE